MEKLNGSVRDYLPAGMAVQNVERFPGLLQHCSLSAALCGASPSGLPPGFCPALGWPKYVSGLLK